MRHWQPYAGLVYFHLLLANLDDRGALAAAPITDPEPDVHGKPVTLHLETLWTRDVTITTGLVDTFSIPQLMRLVASERLDPSLFATHRFPMSDTMAAYDAFADAANTGAQGRPLWPGEHERA